MTIVPGFIDCHNHAGGNTCCTKSSSAIPSKSSSSPSRASSTSSARKLRRPPPGTWVEGYFFDDTKVKDNRQINVQDLDQVSKDHPVAVHHRGGHTSFYNSKALEMAGLDKNTPIRPAELSTTTRMESSTAALPTGREACSTK